MSQPSTDPLSFREVLAAERAAILGDDAASPRPLTALCISGGGIRSATFALGALQGLAEKGLLPTFDYLSTVSGGGYAGSWLTAWIQRAGRDKVFAQLRPDAPPPTPGEVDPIGHLREYNNFLSPKLGAFSADTWTLVATVARNIVLNWFVLVPLLVAVLMVPRLLISIARLGEILRNFTGTTAPVSQSLLVYPGLLIVIASLFAFGMVQYMRELPGVGGQNSPQKRYLLRILLPSMVGSFVFTIFECLYFWGDRDIESSWLQQVSWVLTPLIIAWITFVLTCGKPWRERVRFIVGALPLAFMLMGVSMGTSTWILTNWVLREFSWETFVTVTPPLVIEFLEFGTIIFIGLSSRQLKDDAREWLARSSGLLQMSCLVWTVGCGIVLLAPEWVLTWRVWGPSLVAAIGAAGAWVSQFDARARNDTAASQPTTGRPSAFRRRLVSAAPLVFVLALCIALSIAINRLLLALNLVTLPPRLGEVAWDQHNIVLEFTPWWACLALIVAFAALSAVMGHFVNINKFSLHGMYRNRLTRAYQGASNSNRIDVNSFTGFAESDNLKMADLRGVRPFHLVNTALNLVAGKRLAWQQRKAQSFTISPLHCGNPDLGYRDSLLYGGPTGISLGTAVAISGAAASPNMGYHSSSLGAIVMTLFNARLGAWLGNPGPAGDRTWKNASPHSAVKALTREALGMTDNQSPYVYLSDGGHFENLALYEMILRRCRAILVLDAGCDRNFEFEDLGNALRKIRIDLRVPIEFDQEQMKRVAGKVSRFAVGKIVYPDGPPGSLIYLKATVLGNEPPDVSSYRTLHPDFPHESTADQFYNESQTESYRMLGLQTIRDLCDRWQGVTLEELAAHAATVS